MARNGTPKSKENFRIYMIHAPAEYENARHLRNDLFREFELNVQTVLTEDVDAKSNPPVSLRRELEAADLVIAILTPSAVRSGHVLEQLGAAWALQKPIMPIITERKVLNELPQSVLESPLRIEVQSLEATARAKVVQRVKKERDSSLVPA